MSLLPTWRRGRSGGFTLVEAVLAMLLVSLAALTLGATFMKLSRSEDLAKQQGEATRLANERIEALRAYTQIAAASGVNSWNALATGTDQVTTNAEYTRSWTLGGSSNDTMRTLRVTVSWQDRSNTTQSVAMGTVVARTDPADVGSLGFPLPANTTLKRPKNRNLNIPVPASDLGNGESAFRLPGTNFAVVFSNETGYVVKSCNVASNVTTITLADLSGCSDANAYILAGYISLNSLSSFPTGLLVSTAGLSGMTSATCSVSDATNQNTGSTITGYKYYICVLSMPSAGASWSGTVRLGGSALNAGGSNYRVCRFQYATANGISANQRNVQPYSAVGESLDSQNYVITNSGSCPTVNSLATVQHQVCGSSNASRATDCPAS